MNENRFRKASTHAHAALAAVLAIGANACGEPKVAIGEDPAQQQAADGDGPPGEGGGTAGTTGSASVAGTESDCPLHPDDPETPMTYQLKNATTQDIYVGNGLLLLDAQGAEVSTNRDHNLTCEGERLGYALGGGGPFAHRIPPGATVSRAWRGRYAMERHFSDGCGDLAQRLCVQMRQAESGMTLKFEGYASYACVYPPDVDCGCETTADAPCMLREAEPAGEVLATASVDATERADEIHVKLSF